MSTNLKIIFSLFLAFLFLLSAFFSAAETAYASISPAKLEEAFRKNQRWSKIIKKHHKSFGWTFATILLSNNLVNVAVASLTTYLISSTFGTEFIMTIISTVIVTPILVIFGEVFPKILAKKYSVGYLKKIAHVMNVLNIIFAPLTYPLSKIALQNSVTYSENDIQNLLNLARSEGVIDANEATLAKKALELDSKIVQKVMTPKKNIVWVNRNKLVKDAKKIFRKSGHSRILIKENQEFVGFILLKDIVFAKDQDLISKFIHPIISISKSSLITKALEKMRINNAHISKVIQKQNSKTTIGILTIEDIVEELFGEIYDEHDPKEKIKEIAHHKYISHGSAKMKNLAKELNFKFANVGQLTVKQWIQSRISRTIKNNLRYEYKDVVIFKIIRNKNKKETLIEVTMKIND